MPTSENPEVQVDREIDHDRSIANIHAILVAATLLFAFLAATAFSTGGEFLHSTLEEATFYIAFASSGLSIILLLGPVVHPALHWMNGRQPDISESNLHRNSRAIVIAALLMGLALISLVYFVTETILGTLAAIIAVVVAILVVARSWFWLHW